jgi:hypothetical protein
MSAAIILPALLTGILHLVIHLLALSGCIVLAVRTRRPEAVVMALGAALTTVLGLASTIALTAMMSQKLPHQGYAAISGFLQIGFVLGGLAFGGGLLAFALRPGRSPS